MFVVLLLSLVGSHLNVPLYAMRVERLLPPQSVAVFGRTYVTPPVQEEGTTVIAINVGGALLPVLLSLYLFLRSGMRGRILLGVAIVAAIVPPPQSRCRAVPTCRNYWPVEVILSAPITLTRYVVAPAGSGTQKAA